MENDHLLPELRRKVNYLRKLGCQIHNDKPGGYLVIDCPYRPEDGPDSTGVAYLQHRIDEAIECAEKRNPGAVEKQLTLF